MIKVVFQSADYWLDAKFWDELRASGLDPVLAFGNAKVTCSFVAETTVKTDPTFPNTSPRSPGSEGLRPLTETDFEELGLPPS